MFERFEHLQLFQSLQARYFFMLLLTSADFFQN